MRDDVNLRPAKKGEKVEYREMLIGLVCQDEESGLWRFTDELKGEFWDLNETATKEEAVDALVALKEKRDAERLAFLEQSGE